MKKLALTLVGLLLGVTGCGLTSSSNSTHRPVVLSTYESGGPEGSNCKHGTEHPSSITLACGDLYRFEELRWTHWGEPHAYAVGITRGTRPGKIPVQLTVSEIRACPNGERRYHRLSWSFPDQTPFEPYMKNHKTEFSCPGSEFP